ncbi:hypothetical protein [Rhizobium leguminosarum]
MILDVSTGDRFLFLGGNIRGTYKVEGDAEAEPIVLTCEDGTTAEIARLDLAVLQASGGAVRTFKKGVPIRTLTSQELKGLFEPPKQGTLTESQAKEWEVRRDDVRRASRLLFYVQEYDASSGYGLGETELEWFISETRPTAIEKGYDGPALGFDRVPSPSSIRKALKVGLPGQRTLASYLRKTGTARKKTKFPQFVYDLGREATNYYYSSGSIGYVDAHKFFDERFFVRRGEWLANALDLAEWDTWDGKPPEYQTITNWIKAAECRATLTSKYNAREANRRVRGRGRSIEPLAPLETIILDQTLAPIWCAEKIDVEGAIRIVTKRPWIVWAIDLYSRMLAGFILTYDPPCIATLMACLRHVITPKTEWIDRFGYCKGATDVFGAMSTVILDNAKAHIGRTMQTVGDAAGFKVHLAPIYTPEYKPWIERANATMNNSMRPLPGGIPHESEATEEDIDPRTAALISSESLRNLMAHNIMEYHLDVHSGIGMAPARKYAEGLQEFGRTTVDDARTYKLLLRRHETATLSPEGIKFKGHRFHDQGLTSKLMNDMVRFHSSRKKAKPGQALSFKVHVFYDEMDVSSLTVINEHTKEVVDMPNYDSFLIERPVSFAFSEGERAYQSRVNKEFHDREDKAKARAEYTKDLEAEIANSSHGAAKHSIRVLQGREKPELPPGSRVVDLKVEPTIDGRSKPQEIPVRVALLDRVDVMTAGKGRPPRTRGNSNPKSNARPIIEISPQPEASVVDDEVLHTVDTSFDDGDATLDELARTYGY